MKIQIQYRLNVAAILRNVQGKILVCERLKNEGCWQFPQGGVQREETHEAALGRELWEEISVRPRDYRIVVKKGPYRYDFGEGVVKKGYLGKEQYYFLCDYAGDTTAIEVATAHPEFRAYRWIRPSEFEAAWLPPPKQPVYRSVFADFFNVRI